MDKENNNTMYEIEKIKNKIIQGDSLTELKKFPDESIDMVITSPPYYALRNYGVDGQIGLEPTFEEYLEKILAITAEIKRVLKKSGSF
jgi:DNA modification methylase